MIACPFVSPRSLIDGVALVIGSLVDAQVQELAGRNCATLGIGVHEGQRWRMLVGPVLDQCLVGFDVQVVGGPVERGKVILGCDCLHVGPAVEEQADRLDAPGARRYHERGPAPAAAGRGGRVVQQEAHYVGVAVSARDDEGILADLSVQDEPTVEQQAHYFKVAGLDGLAYGASTKIGRGVAVDLDERALVDHALNNINVAVVARVGQLVSFWAILVHETWLSHDGAPRARQAEKCVCS